MTQLFALLSSTWAMCISATLKKKEMVPHPPFYIAILFLVLLAALVMRLKRKVEGKTDPKEICLIFTPILTFFII